MALGEFERTPLLVERICAKCNSEVIGLLDEQMVRCGPEAFIRRDKNITGRTGHDKVNPFYRGSAGGHRLEMKAFDPDLGFEIVLERTDGEYRQARQLVFVEQVTEKTGHVLIREDATEEELRAAYNRLGFTSPVDRYLISGPEEEKWLRDLVCRTWPGATFGLGSICTTGYPSGASVSFSLTDRYFRAIAKIGFHYFLSQCPQYTGHELMFADIRHYIMTDGQSVKHANKFVSERNWPLIKEAVDGARPNRWTGHVVGASIVDGEYQADVQTFICEDVQPRIYTVRLGQSSIQTKNDAVGHLFIYFRDGPRGKFAGEARLLTPQFSSLRPLLTPVVDV